MRLPCDPNMPIPGWSFHGGGVSLANPSPPPTLMLMAASIGNDGPIQLPNDKFKDIKNATEANLITISDLVEQYSNNRIDKSLTNLNNKVLELKANESITHDRFASPDWGNLRFDLYAPFRAGKLTIKLNSLTLLPNNTTENVTTENVTIAESTIDLTQDATVNITDSNNTNVTDITNMYVNNQTKIGFGRRGFETFQLKLQLPNDLIEKIKNKILYLTFSLSDTQGAEVFIDNVFFQSDYLKFGNSTEARWDSNSPNTNQYSNNLLLEKPQYVSSYNSVTKLPNWVSWKVDSYSLALPPPEENIPNISYYWTPQFISDLDLPTGWNILNNTTTLYDGSLYAQLGMDKGHLIPRSDRNISTKDQLATYLTTNLIPQSIDNNRFFVRGSSDLKDASAWYNIEALVNQLTSFKKELYIFAGAFGNNINAQKKTNNPDLLSKTYNEGNTFPNELVAQSVSIPTWTWKTIIALSDTSADTSADISSSTVQILTYLTPNTAEQVNGVVNPLTASFGNILGIRPLITTSAEWRNPETWRISLGELELILNQNVQLPGGQQFNFLSNVNVPDKIRTSLKTQNNPFPPLPPVSLLAEGDTGNSLENSSEFIVQAQTRRIKPLCATSSECPIGLNNIYKHRPLFSTSTQDTILKINSNELSTTYITPTNNTSSQIAVSELNPSHTSILNLAIPQIARGDSGSGKIRNIPSNISEVTTTQMNLSQINTIENSPSQINTIENSPSQITPSQINSSEVPLPSSIPSQQLLSSNFPDHNPTPISITQLILSAQTIWNNLLPTITPIDITIKVTDLPTGQLADAQITKFVDERSETSRRVDQGNPIEGTIEIDANGNGLGWYIDPTPLQEEEFQQPLTEQIAFKATPDSPAYGKYDLLSTLLHEMGHLEGFVQGNIGFDSHIQTTNGLSFFTGNNLNAQLTHDGSHLNSTIFPYDLLNTSLAPGVRKLPSAIDISILNTIRSITSQTGNKTVKANLTSTPLIAIGNSDFSIDDPNKESIFLATKRKC